MTGPRHDLVNRGQLKLYQGPGRLTPSRDAVNHETAVTFNGEGIHARIGGWASDGNDVELSLPSLGMSAGLLVTSRSADGTVGLLGA